MKNIPPHHLGSAPITSWVNLPENCSDAEATGVRMGGAPATHFLAAIPLWPGFPTSTSPAAPFPTPDPRPPQLESFCSLGSRFHDCLQGHVSEHTASCCRDRPASCIVTAAVRAFLGAVFRCHPHSYSWHVGILSYTMVNH